MQSELIKKEIIIIFFSPPSGRSFKGERVQGYINSLETSYSTVKFIGLKNSILEIKKSSSGNSFKLSGFAVIIFLIFENLGRFFGISNLGRYLGTLYLDLYSSNRIKWQNVDIVLTQPNFLRSIKKAKKFNKKVILESDIDYPTYHWEIMKSRNRVNKIPRRQWPSPNFYPYIARNLISIDLADKIIVFGRHPYETFVNAGVNSNRLILLTPPSAIKSLAVTKRFTQSPIFVYIGNHGLRKAIDVVSDAWAKYKTLGGKGELFIYGKASQSDDKYRRYLKQLPDVHDEGYEDVEKILTSTYKVLLSVSFSEGFPRTVIEFLSAGQLVIANGPGGSELIQEGRNGWKSTADVNELTRTLLEVDEWWELKRLDSTFKLDLTTPPGSNFYIDFVNEIKYLLKSND